MAVLDAGFRRVFLIDRETGERTTTARYRAARGA